MGLRIRRPYKRKEPKLKNQKSVVNFEQEGCIFHLYGEQKPVGGLSPYFFGGRRPRRYHTPFQFGDDQFRGFWLAEGQILPFPIDFEGRPYNTHTIV